MPSYDIERILKLIDMDDFSVSDSLITLGNRESLSDKLSIVESLNFRIDKLDSEISTITQKLNELQCRKEKVQSLKNDFFYQVFDKFEFKLKVYYDVDTRRYVRYTINDKDNKNIRPSTISYYIYNTAVRDHRTNHISCFNDFWGTVQVEESVIFRIISRRAKKHGKLSQIEISQ